MALPNPLLKKMMFQKCWFWQLVVILDLRQLRQENWDGNLFESLCLILLMKQYNVLERPSNNEIFIANKWNKFYLENSEKNFENPHIHTVIYTLNVQLKLNDDDFGCLVHLQSDGNLATLSFRNRCTFG